MDTILMHLEYICFIHTVLGTQRKIVSDLPRQERLSVTKVSKEI